MDFRAVYFASLLFGLEKREAEFLDFGCDVAHARNAAEPRFQMRKQQGASGSTFHHLPGECQGEEKGSFRNMKAGTDRS